MASGTACGSAQDPLRRLGYHEYVDVEKTIEFILDHQARLQVTIASMHGEIASMQAAMVERDAIGRRTDVRLDRAIRLGVEEMRRERERRHRSEERFEETRRLSDERLDRVERGLERLEATVERYIKGRGNGHNGHD